jgi:hypothetical protein
MIVLAVDGEVADEAPAVLAPGEWAVPGNVPSPLAPVAIEEKHLRGVLLVLFGVADNHGNKRRFGPAHNLHGILFSVGKKKPRRAFARRFFFGGATKKNTRATNEERCLLPR